MYVKEQMAKPKVMDTEVDCERNGIQSLREKNMEGGLEFYRFLRRGDMPDHENV